MLHCTTPKCKFTHYQAKTSPTLVKITISTVILIFVLAIVQFFLSFNNNLGKVETVEISSVADRNSTIKRNPIQDRIDDIQPSGDTGQLTNSDNHMTATRLKRRDDFSSPNKLIEIGERFSELEGRSGLESIPDTRVVATKKHPTQDQVTIQLKSDKSENQAEITSESRETVMAASPARRLAKTRGNGLEDVKAADNLEAQVAGFRDASDSGEPLQRVNDAEEDENQVGHQNLVATRLNSSPNIASPTNKKPPNDKSKPRSAVSQDVQPEHDLDNDSSDDLQEESRDMMGNRSDNKRGPSSHADSGEGGLNFDRIPESLDSLMNSSEHEDLEDAILDGKRHTPRTSQSDDKNNKVMQQQMSQSYGKKVAQRRSSPFKGRPDDNYRFENDEDDSDFELDDRRPVANMQPKQDSDEDLSVAAGHSYSKKKKKRKNSHHHGHGHDHGKYYMYAKVPKKKSWEFGFKRGNKKHWIERHEKGHKNKFKTKVKWYDKKSKGKGVHIWDYNHHEKKKHHGR